MFISELRWVVRDGEKILQQKCVKNFTDREWELIFRWEPPTELPVLKFEWRDIPTFLEIEEGDTVQTLCSKPTTWEGDDG